MTVQAEREMTREELLEHLRDRIDENKKLKKQLEEVTEQRNTAIGCLYSIECEWRQGTAIYLPELYAAWRKK